MMMTQYDTDYEYWDAAQWRDALYHEQEEEVATRYENMLDLVTVKYRVKNQYGVDRYYPVSRTAEMICRIKGSKTLTISDLRYLRDYGFMVKEVK